MITWILQRCRFRRPVSSDELPACGFLQVSNGNPLGTPRDHEQSGTCRTEAVQFRH